MGGGGSTERNGLLGCKWMFTMKIKVDGMLERYKLSKVSDQGYTQT